MQKIKPPGFEKQREGFLNMVMDVYKVDIQMIDKFVEVYGKYPTLRLDVDEDKSKMLDLIRTLKINKIKNGRL